MTPAVSPFFHADSSTWSYIVADPASRQAAIIDPVLDFDMAAGRTAIAIARTAEHRRGHDLTSPRRTSPAPATAALR